MESRDCGVGLVLGRIRKHAKGAVGCNKKSTHGKSPVILNSTVTLQPYNKTVPFYALNIDQLQQIIGRSPYGPYKFGLVTIEDHLALIKAYEIVMADDNPRSEHRLKAAQQT